jgi:uncharacterized membrane protein (UPF0127 family)
MAAQATVTIRDKKWSVAIANTPEDLAQGLGGVAGIAPGTGMLFDLGWEQTIQVTTAPMLFPLDVAFFSNSLVVTEVYRHVDPGYIVTSQLPARYFLEVNAGELEGIDSGDQSSVEPIPPTGVLAMPDWVSAMLDFMGLVVMSICLGGLLKEVAW